MKWKLVIDAFNKEKVQIEAFSKYCENDLEILLPPLTPTGGRFLFSRPGNIATASSQRWPVVSCLVTAAAAVLTDSVWDQEMKVTRHSSHCSQLTLSSSLMTLLLINIMLLTADSVLTVFNSPHPFFSIHHLTLSILQVLIQKSIFMHWNLPPSKIADDSSFCFIHNTHNIDRICPDCVRR